MCCPECNGKLCPCEEGCFCANPGCTTFKLSRVREDWPEASKEEMKVTSRKYTDVG